MSLHVALCLALIGSTAAAQSTNELESLDEPIPLHGVPCTNMWPEGNLLYGEAVEPVPVPDYGPFIVYNVKTRQLVYSGNADIHTGFRTIMVDRQSNAYFSVNTTGLAKYSPATNTVSVLPVTLPGVLRAATPQASNGWMYGATNNPVRFFKFNPSTNQIVDLAAGWGYTAHMVLDPTEQFVYSMPDAHGGAWQKGAPVLQFNVTTGTYKVIAFLNNVYESQSGYRIGGTYALDIDREGKRLFMNLNTQKLGTDTVGGFGSPCMAVVHIPPSEATPVSTPALRFVDVAPQTGVASALLNSYIHTASWGDVDNDGRLDLFAGMFVQAPTTMPNKLLLSRGGSFVDSGQVPISIDGRASGSVLADFDNDGDLDLYVSNNTKASGSGPAVEPSHLLRNDNGVFTDVTAGSGIAAQSTNGRQVGVLDYNNDGRLDLFVVADNLVGSGPTVLLRNMGNFTFTDATSAAGLPADINGLGLAIADVTGDGWPDIFVAGGKILTNFMFIANGNGTYRRLNTNIFDWTPFANGNEDWVSGAAFGDLNRDGRLDLLVGHHFGSSAEAGVGARLRVYMNRGLDGSGNPVFEDITMLAGLPPIISKSPHVEIQDFDNDGWPDLYTSVRVDAPGGPVPLIFRHAGLMGGDPTFESPAMTNPHYYAGGPVADFNGDGKLDVFFPEWRSLLGTVVPSMLMQNTGAPGNWLQVKVDTAASRMGVGAKVKVYEPGQAGVASALIGFTEITPAFGFSSSQPAIAHFGLGARARVDVVVTMPFAGTTYTRAQVPANRLLVVPNGEVERAPHLALETTAQTNSSSAFITEPAGVTLPSHTTASTAPTVDFAVVPKPAYAGNPWSHWGAGLLASNGRYYTGIGDHQGTDGNSFVYEYDPATKKLLCLGDVATATSHVAGSFGHGKLHSRMTEGRDGYVYVTTYWGTRTGLTFNENYQGSVLLRFPTGAFASGSGGGEPPPDPPPPPPPSPGDTPPAGGGRGGRCGAVGLEALAVLGLLWLARRRQP